jgi:Zn-dependent protease with chaperone function
MLDAGYFDGHTSRRHLVRLRLTAEGLEIAGDGWQRVETGAAIRVSEPIGGAPRTLTFPDGAYCEVAQGESLNQLLAGLGHREGFVVRWQGSWRIVALALTSLVVMLLAGYRWGLPWIAERAAPRFPPALVASLSENALKLLDRSALSTSQLPEQRQRELEQRFRLLIVGDPALVGSRLLFRHAGKLGPNAFALPDGRIVLFDELVALADGDGEVLAVLSHELGHVRFHHGLRQIIQSSVVAVAVASYFGDVSSLLSGFSTLLLESNYSRSFELQADDFGAQLLRRCGQRPQDLAVMLEKLEKAHEGTNSPQSVGADWLSSHPATAERIGRLHSLN